MNTEPNPTLAVFLLLCQPVYVIISNKYCVWIRWLVLVFVTAGLLFRITQVFRGIELHPDGLIFFVLLFMTLPSLVLITFGLYFWFKEKRLKKYPKAGKLIDAVAILTIIFVIINIVSNPLRQPVDEIEKALLEDIPIGTSFKEVRLCFVKDEDILRTERNGIVDLGDGEFWQKRKFDWHRNDKDIITNKEDGGLLYEAGLGKYQGFPWVTHVRTQLIFGADHKLKYIEVYKIQDAL